MKINEILADKTPTISFEVFPPKAETGLNDVKTAAGAIGTAGTLLNFLMMLFSMISTGVTVIFLEIFLYSSPVTYWAPTDLGSSSFSVVSKNHAM